MIEPSCFCNEPEIIGAVGPAPNGKIVDTTRILAAMQMLREAACLAKDAGNDPWDFAVELPNLLDLGISLAMCRWLVAKGFVLHRRELTREDEVCRHFGPVSQLKIVDRSCFIITNSGLEVLCNGKLLQTPPQTNVPANLMTIKEPRPGWFAVRKELIFRGTVVKRFRLPAPNQELILSVFEEEQWRFQIDDPLPHRDDMPPKQRLHDTIKALNQNQATRLIRFSGDGRGTGVRWQPLECSALSD
jgi:hypothetical protein